MVGIFICQLCKKHVLVDREGAMQEHEAEHHSEEWGYRAVRAKLKVAEARCAELEARVRDLEARLVRADFQAQAARAGPPPVSMLAVAAEEDARESTGVPDVGASAVVGKNLSPAEAPCEPALSSPPAEPELYGRFLADHHEPTRCVLPKGHAPVCDAVAAEPELWGVWCEPLEVNVAGWYRFPNGRRLESPLKPLMLGLDQLPGWRYEARPIPRGKDREATKARFRSQAAKAGPPPVSMLAVGAAVEADPSPMPTAPGHYELTPSGEWRLLSSEA